MKDFAALYRALDASTSTRAKQDALQRYLRAALPADAAWAVYVLAGGKPRQLVPTKVLRTLAQQAAALPEWLFDECYEAVGDLAETIALLLPPAEAPLRRPLAEWINLHLLPLRELGDEQRVAELLLQWRTLPDDERFVYLKLITGALRVGVSRLQVTQALAAVAGVDAKTIAQRLMGYTHPQARPDETAWAHLVEPVAEVVDGEDLPAARGGHPYPFFLAHPLPPAVDTPEALAAELGSPDDWLVEWKWDGIRAQLVCREGQAWLWSRGEELVTDRFPEVATLAAVLPPGTVLDGELVVWRGGLVQPFAELQRRIGRKTLGPKLLGELPVALLAYDLLEQGGQDLRQVAQHERRARLEALVAAHPHPSLRLSPRVPTAQGWAGLAEQRAQSRALGVEGLMLKSQASAYGSGRTRVDGVWWKWKIEPYAVDAVLVYAQRGHGRRASLYTDYTFAVWNGPPEDPARALVPFAKAYSGLTDEEMKQVDAIIRRTTRESFGPVRSVEPTLVFELGFEGIARSPRHKSGIAVRFPRMLRWRQDKPVSEADTLQTLSLLLPGAKA
ncbi:ATP-dependent DNA ligase [Ideonella azotifigens]|uniref:DNA ligase (ATP) n=2 Tax=Ideonella azotifigens TaxID=513160 RepID=A0ABN1JYV1_9BURK|nr:ATP-dependent DNA ligase [Ideonella azotifigens]MCD2342793.1 ATP-dependent DNA ligase [Ideonella azotifigens]